MKNSKKILSGLLALTLTAGLSACGGGADEGGANNAGGGDAAAETTQAETVTTTAATVEINTETLAAEEEDALAGAMEQLQDVELENEEIKWLAHYDLNPAGSGASKSVAQEMFERKYGGSIKWYQTTWENRFNDLSTYVLGGEGIDFFPGDDVYNFPKGIISGMFMPVDEYIDMESPIWAENKAAMDLYNFGGRYFNLVTSVTAEEIVIYNTETIEANGLDDPWELYEAGNWNWDTFKSMLEEFVEEENDQWGIDGYWAENALLLSGGVPTVESVDGQLVCNLNDPGMEKAMNYQYDLFNAGLVFPREQFNWAEQPAMMGEGRQLFYIVGAYSIQADPATWVTKIDPENVGIVPVPSPADSDPYAAAKLNGFAICKGATNPQGVALFAECNIVGGKDEAAIAISDRKTMDDFQWSEELIAKNKEINELARQYPVVDLASGCSTDIASYTTQGGDNVGTRAALHGTDWASNREMIADVITMLVDEVNTELQNKIAELG
ncbi:MAG: hypothetical protein J6A05_06630 [Oscillospiraceae bacterium]|nr:hypothetical protein [Oscillospiraceae bacterium]